MAEARKVLHVASHRINVGDGALVQAIQLGLRRASGARLEYVDFEIVDLEPEYGGVDFQGVDLSPYSLVLVGGGGTIDNRRTRSRSGMAFPMSGDDVRRSATPLAYVAIGYNLFAGTRLRHGDALADLLRACGERGFPFAVRNDGSLGRLRAEVGSAADGVVSIPDPGFFVEVDAGYTVPQFSGRRPRVLVQLAGDNPGFRFGGSGEWIGRVRNRLPLALGRGLIGQVAELVRWLASDLGAEVVLAPHISSDLLLTAGVLDKLPTGVRRKRVRVLGVADPSRAAQFFAAYAQADLVIGMRGHSVICAVGLGTPCIALSTHPKVGGFMAECGLSDWVVEYGEGFADPVKRMSESLLRDPSPQHALRDAATVDFGRRWDDFLARCARLMDERAGPPG